MFEKGQVILYGNQGIFKVTGTEIQTFAGIDSEYYVLEGIFETQRKVYVPMKSPKLIEKMKPVLSRDEVENLIDSIPNRENIWIDNENRRKEAFREILSSGNRGSLLDLITTLSAHRTICRQNGRKMHQCDERAYKEAEKLVYEEFCYVLDIPQQEIVGYITNRVPAFAS
ncbi:MAG: CarD family transcriptional regulator [Clostridia bacterium]|nr:CarD family transcriptional regulator [Clostridia bacterium]